MASGERLTIDVTVARDYLDARRAGHSDAVALFELARSGEVELATAPQGYRLDVRGDLAEQLQAAFENEGVRQAPQLSYPSAVTYPGKDLFPGRYVEGFGEAWSVVVEDWRSHERKPPTGPDRFHVETHVVERRDVFLTGDRALLVMCRRLTEEHGFPITAMTVADYLERRVLT
jgi:hypothetical protein